MTLCVYSNIPNSTCEIKQQQQKKEEGKKKYNLKITNIITYLLQLTKDYFHDLRSIVSDVRWTNLNYLFVKS